MYNQQCWYLYFVKIITTAHYFNNFTFSLNFIDHLNVYYNLLNNFSHIFWCIVNWVFCKISTYNAVFSLLKECKICYQNVYIQLLLKVTCMYTSLYFLWYIFFTTTFLTIIVSISLQSILFSSVKVSVKKALLTKWLINWLKITTLF